MRLAAFVISAVYGGIGGVILAVTTGLADPELAYWTHSGNLVFMAVLGGSGTFAGPAIGALAFVLLQDFVMSITQYWRFVMGAVLVLLVVFMPQGLSGAAEFLVNQAQGRALTCSPTALRHRQARRCSKPSAFRRPMAPTWR
jgi:branched-chain amino acid transport system permease protein